MVDFGSLQPLVDGVGAVMAIGGSLYAAVVGKYPLSPPVEGRNFVNRLIMLGCAVAAITVWYLGHGIIDTADLDRLAIAAAGLALLFGVIYALAYQYLYISCPHDDARYLVGLFLKKEARRVLAGELNLPPPYGPLPAKPNGRKSYFCNSEKDLSHLWSDGSITLAAGFLTLLYAALLVMSVVALSAIWMVWFKVDLTVKTVDRTTHVEMPADVLFAFDRADIQSGALPILDEAARILRKRGVHHATIEGHADISGPEPHNVMLSYKRAIAVRDWLTGTGDLEAVRFAIAAFGSSNGVAPNFRPDQTPDPEGRARNRRVDIVFNQDGA